MIAYNRKPNISQSGVMPQRKPSFSFQYAQLQAELRALNARQSTVNQVAALRLLSRFGR